MHFSFLFLVICIKCDSNYFKSNPVFVFPSSMKTKATSKGFYEYTFSGIQFQVFGKFNKPYTIYLDDKYYTTVNYVPSNDSQPQYTSKIFSYAKHTIKLICSDQDFEISKISYTPSLNARKIHFDAFTQSGTWRDYDQGTPVKYTFDNGAYISIQIRCSKFWVHGIEDNGHGDIGVQFGNLVKETFSEYNEQANYNDHVVYESPDFPLTYAELKLTKDNENAKSISIAYIVVLAEQMPYPAAEPVPISVETMQNVGMERNSNDECPLNGASETPCGLILVSKDKSQACTIEHSFKGVRFQVFGTFGPGLGSYRILLDGYVLDTINQNFVTQQKFSLQYTSDIYPYADHTIKIEANAGESIEISKFTYTISLNAKQISYDNLQNGHRIANTLGGLYYFANQGTVLKKTVSCSKIWIVGHMFSDFDSIHVSFGEYNGDFNSRSTNPKLFTIIGESPQFEHTTNELIINNIKTMIYHGIYIIDEPENEFPISVPVSSLNSVGPKGCSFDPECPEDKISTFNCGEKCWSTDSNTLTYTYTFKGVKFQVFGTNHPSHRRFFIYLNDTFQARINERFSTMQQFSLLYSSEILPYGEHTIKIESSEVFELWKISYWVSMNAKKILSTEFNGIDDWKIESDLIGDLQLKAEKNSISIRKPIYASKFWIIGSGQSSQITVKNRKYEASSMIPTTESFAVIHESPELPCYYDDLMIIANNNGIIINCFYYIDDNCPQPTNKFSRSDAFSLSNQFSSSIFFSESGKFSSTGLFSKSDLFSNTDFFSQSSKFSKTDFFSQSIDFSRTDFFSQSLKFSNTFYFSQSEKFNTNGLFSLSCEFSSTFFFSESARFSYSDIFSKITYSNEPIDTSESIFSKEISFSNNEEYKSFEEASEIIISTVKSSSDEKIESSLKSSEIISMSNETGTMIISKGNKNITVLIVGIVVGIILFIALLIIIIIIIIRRKKQKESSDDESVEVSFDNTDNHTNEEIMNHMYEGKLHIPEDPFLHEMDEDEI